MRLIALFGPKGSGKDAAARMLRELHAEDARREGDARPLDERVDDDTDRIEFAEPIRWALEAAGVPPVYLRDLKDEPCPSLAGRTGREAMVAWGEAMRGLDPDYFARFAVERARDLGGDREYPGASLVVISDGRLATEARHVREAGGLCAWIHRPEAHERRHEDRVYHQHAHELCHLEVDNSGDLDHLRAECRRVLDAAMAMPEVRS